MKTLNVLNYPIYQFESDLTLADDVLSDLRNKNFVKLQHPSYSYMLGNYFHDNLFNFFENCIEQVKSNYFKPEISFPIIDCWVNKFSCLQTLANHTHSNSLISGLYYLTSHEKDGATSFSIPDPWSDHNYNPYTFLTIYKETQWMFADIFPTKGTLLLFPSKIAHKVKPIKNTKDVRYTISFNCFPQGVFETTDTVKLELSPVSVRQKNKTGN